MSVTSRSKSPERLYAMLLTDALISAQRLVYQEMREDGDMGATDEGEWVGDNKSDYYDRVEYQEVLNELAMDNVVDKRRGEKVFNIRKYNGCLRPRSLGA